MDLAGLGDSGVRPGREVNETFPLGAIDDVRAAVECLRSRFGVTEVTLGGMCSGAYHALRAAVEGLPVKQILMVNPLTYFWEEGMNEEDVQPWEVVHKPGAYLGRALSMDSWRRLWAGDVSIWRVLKIYLIRPWLAVQSSLRDLARHLHIRLKNDVGWELQQLAARGIRIVFVFSRGDAGIGLLQLQTGLSAKKLSERYRVRTIEGADHDFTRSASRAALEDVLSEELAASRS
jgi:pimeloyl-ACP methyl ester carboxylesterase